MLEESHKLSHNATLPQFRGSSLKLRARACLLLIIMMQAIHVHAHVADQCANATCDNVVHGGLFSKDEQVDHSSKLSCPQLVKWGLSKFC